MCPCFSIGYYQPYFDVDTSQVVERLKSSLFFCKSAPFLQLVEDQPDAYGPFWICTTLVFTVAFTAHLSAYFAFEGEDFQYDFKTVTFCAMSVYGYFFAVPVVFWALFNYWLKVPLSFIQLLCVIGYSLAIYIPLSFVCVISVLSWPALLAACISSTLFLIKTMMPILTQHVPNQMVLVLGGMMVANVCLLLALKLGSYS